MINEGQPFLCPDPFSLLGEKIDEEIFPQVLRGGVESPAVVDLGTLLDELNQVGILPEHKDVQIDAVSRAFFELQRVLASVLGSCFGPPRI